MNTQIVTNVQSRVVTLGIQGAPNSDNRYGPGWMRPTQVRITYWYDGSGAETDTSVRVFGMWTRENGEETDHVMDQSYDRPQRNWPGWLVDIVRANKP
jgi:hypothetical protein